MHLGKLNLRIGRPQRIAAVFLLIFLAQCLYVVRHQQLTEADYRFARCGCEMWERPSAVTGYYTTCGNLHGDGTLAYRVAGEAHSGGGLLVNDASGGDERTEIRICPTGPTSALSAEATCPA